MNHSPKRAQLNHSDIVHAAIALVDTEGIGQLTMRRVGSALGVEAMALYRYFPSRRDLLDALVETVIAEVATDPASQMVPDDDWTDYLHRLAHGVRRMALTHPRVFPLVATHPTEAPWIRPPIRSVRWVDAFLAGLQDHHFPPAAAVAAYKEFSTFLLGRLLLEVSALGLEHPDEASAPPPRDRDKRDAERLRRQRADQAASVLRGDDAPEASEIVAAGSTRPQALVEQAAVVAMDPTAGGGVTADGHGAHAVAVDADIPLVAAVVSTSVVGLDGYPSVSALAGLLAHDTSAADFDRGLTRLLGDFEQLRRP